MEPAPDRCGVQYLENTPEEEQDHHNNKMQHSCREGLHQYHPNYLCNNKFGKDLDLHTKQELANLSQYRCGQQPRVQLVDRCTLKKIQMQPLHHHHHQQLKEERYK